MHLSLEQSLTCTCIDRLYSPISALDLTPNYHSGVFFLHDLTSFTSLSFNLQLWVWFQLDIQRQNLTPALHLRLSLTVTFIFVFTFTILRLLDGNSPFLRRCLFIHPSLRWTFSQIRPTRHDCTHIHNYSPTHARLHLTRHFQLDLFTLRLCLRLRFHLIFLLVFCLNSG